MGMHPDGILFYGYHLPQDTELPEEVRNLWGEEHNVLVGGAYSYDYPIRYIYVVESRVYAYEAGPVQVTDTTVSVQWDQELKDFALKYDIPFAGDDVDMYGSKASAIGWWLTALYG